jgi:3-phosphoshikimate 1-carboxyvinyltransferase
MGARIDSRDGRPPLVVRGGALHGIDHVPEVPSAQVKSAVLLAGIQAEGVTRVHEPVPTRDHTERAFDAFGVPLEIVTHEGRTLEVRGGSRPTALEAEVPGDVSSAAYWAVAAAGLAGSSVEILDVGLNPTRTAVLDVLARAGAGVDIHVERVAAAEPRGRVQVRAASLTDIRIDAADVPALIDELPALAALAAFGVGVSVDGAAELRAKESDRISALVRGLRGMGLAAEETPAGCARPAAQRAHGGLVDAAGDHRLAMVFAIAALGATGPTRIAGADAVAVSYPAFFAVVESLRA